MSRWLASILVFLPALMDAAPAFARRGSLPTTPYGWFLFGTIFIVLFAWIMFSSRE